MVTVKYKSGKRETLPSAQEYLKGVKDTAHVETRRLARSFGGAVSRAFIKARTRASKS